MKKALVLPLFAAGFLAAPAAVQAQDAGAVLSAPCAGCHGPAGVSTGDIPTINGMAAADIAKALSEFKSGARAATVMTRIAKGYTDDQLQVIAAALGKK